MPLSPFALNVVFVPWQPIEACPSKFLITEARDNTDVWEPRTKWETLGKNFFVVVLPKELLCFIYLQVGVGVRGVEHGFF